MSSLQPTSSSSNNNKKHPLQNVALLARLVPFVATSVKRLVHLSFTTSMWSDCIAIYSKSTWENFFAPHTTSSSKSSRKNPNDDDDSDSDIQEEEEKRNQIRGYEKNTAERLAMRSCNLGLFEIARVVAGNPAAARLRDSSGWSCLHQASFSGRPGTCTLLLQVPETEVNALDLNGWTPARCAVYNVNTSVMKVLCTDHRTNVNIPCNQGDTPLLACIAAANTSRLEMMEVILSTKPQKPPRVDDEEIPIVTEEQEAAMEKQRIHQIVNYQNTKTGLSAIFVAVKNRDERAVEILLKYGADVVGKEVLDKWNRTPLMFIAAAPEVVSLPMVKLLLEKGARIYKENPSGNEDYMVDSKGNSVFDVVKSQKVKKMLEEAAEKEYNMMTKV